MTDSIEAAVTALPPGDVPATPATEAGTATVGESTNVASASSPSESVSAAPAVSDPIATAVTEAPTAEPTSTTAGETTGSATESPNSAPAADAGAHEAGDAPAAGGDVPNVAPAVAEPTTEPGSATSAAGADTTSPIAESSPADALPLRAQVAQHLEAIYRAVANADKPVIDEAYSLKQHIGDVLQSIHNGIDVRSGEMVQKLEALFHKL